MVGSKCNLKMLVRNPTHLQTGGPETTFFGRIRNSTATLIAYIFGMKHDIHKRVSALQTIRRLLHRLKTTWTLVHKRLQIESEFSPTLRKFCIPLHCQASQTEISKWNSTTLCQTVDALTICCRKVGVVSPKKNLGPKTVTFVRFFNDYQT